MSEKNKMHHNITRDQRMFENPTDDLRTVNKKSSHRKRKENFLPGEFSIDGKIVSIAIE
jgi:hypothetical protein